MNRVSQERTRKASVPGVARALNGDYEFRPENILISSRWDNAQKNC